MPRIATALVAVAAFVALAVVLTRPGGTSDKARGEVFLQPAADSGPAPFTESTAAREATPPPQDPPPPAGRTQSPTGPASPGLTTRSVSGAAPGLYGGTKNIASCDVEKQVEALSAQPAKNGAFASALGLEPAAVPGYLRSLTPMQLRWDTRVTNHGYRDGKATAYQAVLQAGTAVLVDDRGVPRVRCACGNPLAPPVALKADPKRLGSTWSTYRPAQVVVIAPSVKIVNTFVIYDHRGRGWYERDRGDHHGKHDKPVPPPVVPSPPVPPPPSDSPASSPAESGSAPPSVSTSPLQPVAPSEASPPEDSPASPPAPSVRSAAPSSAASEPPPPPPPPPASSASPPAAPRVAPEAPAAEPPPDGVPAPVTTPAAVTGTATSPSP
ncbi:DUF6777 domain-containing protein [Streptomyces sp. NPDC091268]|uniref:DUF6777 domain-containing protein n=1 Tax=Streptomyces sp. NPDC091268 TaxID=3365979 RepID=UPI0037F62A1A